MARMKTDIPILCFLLGCLFCISYFQVWIPWKVDIRERMTLNVYFFQQKSQDHSDATSFWPTLTENDDQTSENGEVTLPKCPETPPRLLGPLEINVSLDLSIEEIWLAYPNVELGGHFKPPDCTALQRIAVIIPFRRQEPHLKIWLFYMHQFLQRQQADYGIYVIEQHGDGQFNRAKLMNVGFVEALKDYNYNCFIFSDIDIIPMDDRNYYRCYSNPRHMANAVDKFNSRSTLFGGAVAFSKEQYAKVNGFSNKFWGWGGEDNELYKRVVTAGMKVERPNSTIARYKTIPHGRDPGNETNKRNVHPIELAPIKMHEDGVSSLKYEMVSIARHRLYTRLSVEIWKPEEE